MRTALQIAVAFAPLVCAGAIPCIQIVRGRRILPQFVLCWALLVLWLAAFAFGAPLIALQFSRDAARSVADWVPEGPAVVAMLVFGWAYAGVIVGVAAVMRYVIRHLRGESERAA